MASIASLSNTRREGLTTYSWITPQWLLDELGHFDLDPCACDPQPWPTATRMITERENGLLAVWAREEFVYCNPPYGRALGVWLNRMALHNNGIALVFARTDTQAFFQNVWPFARSLLFLRGRLTFCYPDGTAPANGHNSGGPSCLIAYGERASKRLINMTHLGQLVTPYRTPTIF